MSKKRTAITSKLTAYLKYFIKEIIPVTAGILIALSIGNWNQIKKDQKFIKEVLSISNNELNETLEEINRVMPQQQSMADSLNFYAHNQQVSLMEIVLKARGIYIANIRDNAWKALSSTRIELVDYKLISILSDIEEQKEILRMKTTNISNFLYANLNDTGEDKKMAFKLMMLDVISTETSAKKLIEELKKNWPVN